MSISNNRRVLITGVNGQDGSYLAHHLQDTNYEVHGMIRRTSAGRLDNIDYLIEKGAVKLHHGDICDPQSFTNVIDTVDPHIIFHMADQDNVDWSFSSVGYSMDVTAKAVATLLEHLRTTGRRWVKVFLPCSAMMFGDAPGPQNEYTPFAPQSPYACAKVAAYHLGQYYRKVHHLNITTGIMYNHDSPRRNGNYLLHRICKAAIRKERLSLSALWGKLSIGYASTYMKAVQQIVCDPDRPSTTFVMGTQNTCTLAELVDFVYDCVGLRGIDYVDRQDESERPGNTQTLIPNTTRLKVIYPQWDDPVEIQIIVHQLLEKYGRKS